MDSTINIYELFDGTYEGRNVSIVISGFVKDESGSRNRYSLIPRENSLVRLVGSRDFEAKHKMLYEEARAHGKPIKVTGVSRSELRWPTVYHLLEVKELSVL